MIQRTIPCLNCGGSGYVVQIGGDGMKRPVTCNGCDGSGRQTVKVGPLGGVHHGR